MTTVIDVTQAAREMVRLCQEVTESGLLEQVRDTVTVADGYLRRGAHAAREQQPPAEDPRPPVADIGADARELGRQMNEHRTLIQAAAKHATELRAYVSDLEHLFGRLAG